MRIKIEELKQLAENILEKKGVKEEDIPLIIEEYLDGELRERKGHDFSSFPKFCIKKLDSYGKELIIEKDEDSFMLVNGNGGLGQIVMPKLLPKIIQKAKDKGIAMLGIYNMHPYMMPGTWARKTTEHNVIAIIYNYGGTPRVAPTGSIDPIFATNPIAFGVPSTTFPIVVDMATSKYAMGKVKLSKKLGIPLPKDMAIDKNGNPTTNPDEAIEGALLPFGDYKGYAMSLMVEVLSRVMFDIQLDENTKGKRGYFMIFIDPSKFGDINKFKQNTSDLINKIKSSRKAKGTEEIFLPGERSEKIKQENLKKGFLDIDDKFIQNMKELL